MRFDSSPFSARRLAPRASHWYPQLPLEIIINMYIYIYTYTHTFYICITYIHICIYICIQCICTICIYIYIYIYITLVSQLPVVVQIVLHFCCGGIEEVHIHLWSTYVGTACMLLFPGHSIFPGLHGTASVGDQNPKLTAKMPLGWGFPIENLKTGQPASTFHRLSNGIRLQESLNILQDTTPKNRI